MKFIWPPILEAIEERQAADRGRSRCCGQRARKSLEKAAAAEADEIVAEARKQATGILDQAQCSRKRNRLLMARADGVKERERQLSAAKAEIEQEANRAREELRGQVFSYRNRECREDSRIAKSTARRTMTFWASLLRSSKRRWQTTTQ